MSAPSYGQSLVVPYWKRPVLRPNKISLKANFLEISTKNFKHNLFRFLALIFLF